MTQLSLSRRQRGISMVEMIGVVALMATIAVFSQSQMVHSFAQVQSQQLATRLAQVGAAAKAYIQANGSSIVAATGAALPPAYTAANYCLGFASNAGVVISPFNATFDGTSTTSSVAPTSDSSLYGNTTPAAMCIVPPSLLARAGFLPIGSQNILPDGNGIMVFVKQWAKTVPPSGAQTQYTVAPSGSLVLLTLEVPPYVVNADGTVTFSANPMPQTSISNQSSTAAMLGSGGGMISNTGCPAGTQPVSSTVQICGNGWIAPISAFMP